MGWPLLTPTNENADAHCSDLTNNSAPVEYQLGVPTDATDQLDYQRPCPIGGVERTWRGLVNMSASEQLKRLSSFRIKPY
jgi:hypothetical protein